MYHTVSNDALTQPSPTGEREMEPSGNRDFAVQIDVLNRIDQLHAVGHRFLKRLTAKDQPHAARAFVDHRRTHRV